MATTDHEQLLHSGVLQALTDLSDPNKGVVRSLTRGASLLEVQQQVFPPRNIHRNSFPARYTFILEGYVEAQAELMINLADVMDGHVMVFGLLAHDYWDRFSQEAGGAQVEPAHRYAAVKYDPTTRRGSIFFYKDAYAAIERANTDRLAELHKED